MNIFCAEDRVNVCISIYSSKGTTLTAQICNTSHTITIHPLKIHSDPDHPRSARWSLEVLLKTIFLQIEQ